MLCKKIQDVIDESDECLCSADEKDAEHICSTFHEHVATEIYKVFLQRGGKLSLLRQAVSKVIDRNTTDLPMPPVPLAKEELHLEAVTLNSDVDAEPSAGSSQAVPWEFRFLEDGRDVLSVAEIPGDRASSWNGYRHFFSLNETWRFRTAFAGWYSKSFHGTTLPLLREWDFSCSHVPWLLSEKSSPVFCCLLSVRDVSVRMLQVLRRPSYKGQQESEDAGLKLPVDAASVPGHVACIGSILKNKGCTKQAYNAAWQNLDAWDRHLDADRSFPLLPHVIGSDVHVRQNKIRMDELQSALQAVDMQSYCALIQQCLSTNSDIDDASKQNAHNISPCSTLGTSPMTRWRSLSASFSLSCSAHALAPHCATMRISLGAQNAPSMSGARRFNACYWQMTAPFLIHARTLPDVGLSIP